MNHPFLLLRERRFLPLFITQFLGALNDNVIKNAMIVLLTFQASHWTTLAPGLLANLAAGVFILPFFLFSASAGQLADKYDKAWLTRWVKLFELVIVFIAGTGFWLQQLPILLLALFLLGLHSTIFGPIKYAILPQHLAPAELLGGNALIESGTFIAILLGSLLGGLLAGMKGALLWIPVVGGIIALGGYFSARAIPVAVPPAPTLSLNRNPFVETLRNLAYARQNRSAFGALLGISWFWLYGAIFLVHIPLYAKEILHGDETSVTLLLVAFIVGIGAGSMLCDWLIRQRRARVGWLIFAGGIGLSLCAFDLYLASPVMPAASSSLLNATALLQQPGVTGTFVREHKHFEPVFHAEQAARDLQRGARTQFRDDPCRPFHPAILGGQQCRRPPSQFRKDRPVTGAANKIAKSRCVTKRIAVTLQRDGVLGPIRDIDRWTCRHMRQHMVTGDDQRQAFNPEKHVGSRMAWHIGPCDGAAPRLKRLRQFPG